VLVRGEYHEVRRYLGQAHSDRVVLELRRLNRDEQHLLADMLERELKR